MSFKWSPSLRFPHQNPARTSPLPHTCYKSCPSVFLVITRTISQAVLQKRTKQGNTVLASRALWRFKLLLCSQQTFLHNHENVCIIFRRITIEHPKIADNIQSGFKITVHIIMDRMSSVAWLSLLRCLTMKVAQLYKTAHLSNILQILQFLVHICFRFVAVKINANCEFKTQMLWKSMPLHLNIPTQIYSCYTATYSNLESLE